MALTFIFQVSTEMVLFPKGRLDLLDKLIEYLWKNPKVMQITTNYAERLTIFPKHILSNLKFPDIKLVPLK